MNRRLPRSKLREILRMKLHLGQSHRQTARSLRISPATVSNVVTRAQKQALDWDEVDSLKDAELGLRIYPSRQKPNTCDSLPAPALIHAALQSPGTTLRDLHARYSDSTPHAYGYTTFCEHYRVWRELRHEAAHTRWRARVRAEDRRILEEWRRSNDRRKWERAVAVLDSNRGCPLSTLAEKTERSRRKLQRWITAYNDAGILGVSTFSRRHQNPKRVARKAAKKKRLLELLHHSPRDFGINRSNWSLHSVAQAYETRHGQAIGMTTVSDYIRPAGYSFRRAKTVLTSPDPEYRTKVEMLLRVLHSLKPDDLFFFVDELGPLRIKKYGGRSYVKRGSLSSVPQRQEYKGSITLSGALSATTNQLTWVFSDAKDTSAMIDLMEILFSQHIDARTIYITWDAASWHHSIPLVEWLDSFNAKTREFGAGPKIDFVPLPTSSQFLDVIEAVFSGMKRAVIHHSDYPSSTEMKAAISQHFVQRNCFFQENPKRAGKKIWDIDFFSDYCNLRSGDYREW